MEDLLVRLDEIDTRSHELALAVSDKPELRSDVEEEAEQLAAELHELADKIRDSSTPLYNARAVQISETTLDLAVARCETSKTSLRLYRFGGKATR